MVATSNKKVVDEVACWLKIYDDGSVDRTWTGPPEAKFIVEPVSPHENFVDGVATRDLTVDNDSLRVRIYRPEPDSEWEDLKKLPIILHFHGGGFCISQPDWLMYYHFYSRLSRAARAIVVSPFLRQAPEHRLPAAFDDGLSALEWVARGESWVGKYGDLERVFLVGDSAGGNVVHQVAARARGAGLRVAGAVAVNPGFVREERSRSEREKPETQMLTLEMMDKLLGMGLPVGATKDHPYTCPMNESESESELVGPLLVCVSEDDLMRDTQVEYYEHMKKKSHDVQLVTIPGMAHCFYLNKLAVDSDPHVADNTAMLIARITHFINHH